LSVVNAESPMLEFGLRIKKKKRKKSYNANATELILMQTAEQTEECYALSWAYIEILQMDWKL